MVRTAPVSAAFLIAAGVFALCFGDTEYEVTVTNLTYMQSFSAILLVAHTEDIKIFEKGAASTDEFRVLAETGDLTDILALLGDAVNECCLCGLEFGEIALAPGDAQTFTITVDEDICTDVALFSMASMLENTNDAFFGIDSMVIELNSTTPDLDLPAVVYASAFDAGTELNNELCSHIPGPACDAMSGNEQAEPGEGFIHIHRGFRGVGPDLADEIYDWRNPVAEICIS